MDVRVGGEREGSAAEYARRDGGCRRLDELGRDLELEITSLVDEAARKSNKGRSEAGGARGWVCPG
jgi:hypothetical protein